MTDTNIRHMFSYIYKTLKENTNLPLSLKPFVEHAKLFSIPICNKLLVITAFSKLLITLFYFIYTHKTFISSTIILVFILFILSILITIIGTLSKYIKILQSIDQYILIRLLRVFYLLIFFYEENYTTYYHQDFTYQLSPKFEFVLHVVVFFFESQQFEGGLLYLYLLNFLSFLAFLSWRNFSAVYFPVNVVIGIFILISVVAHYIGRELTKREIFFKFYEKILDLLSRELGINIVYDEQIVYPYERKGKNVNERVFDDLMSESQSVRSMSSMDQDSIMKINDKDIDLKRVNITGFEGFEIAYSTKNQVQLRKTSFMNK